MQSMPVDRPFLPRSPRGTTKRSRTTNSEPYTSRKRRCLDQSPSGELYVEARDLGECARGRPTQLPSPTLTKSDRDFNELSFNPITSQKRKAESLDVLLPSKRARLISEPPYQTSSIDTWLSKLPKTFEPVGFDQNLDDMSQPPSKRSRSSDSLGRALSQSGDGSETVVSRDKKYSLYKDANYPVVLETKGSFMRPSKAGMVEEDKKLCERLLTISQPVPHDTFFDDDHFSAFHGNLRGRSEARICTDLHPRIMPSVENLTICGREEFGGLIEGHNDPWIKSIPFYGPRPQPDHTYGFKWSNFNEQQRRKLNIEPTKKSLYTAREDIYFPFLTGEVKCGKQGLDLADRPNAHSMSVTLRGVADVYRRANRLKDVHRRLLGLSISHDDNGLRLYAHYPEVDGDDITFWRETLREFSLSNDKGKERWTCYHFTLNVCQMFALPFLERLRSVIDLLSDPATQSFGLTTPFDKVSVQGSSDDVSGLESQDESLKKTSSRRGPNVELKNMIQSLQRQLEQQRDDAERQREAQQTQMAEQQRQSKEQLALLERQLVEQQKQNKEQTEQYKEQIRLLNRLLERKEVK